MKITVDQKPDVLRLPLNFVGGFRWLVSEVFREPLSLETVFPVEKDAGSMEPGEGWKPVSWPENALEIEPLFKGRPGVIYLRHFIYSPDARDVMLGVPNNNAILLEVILGGPGVVSRKKGSERTVTDMSWRTTWLSFCAKIYVWTAEFVDR
ncbi:hypothetical protein CW712_02870 [Candidatus Bathyarchaeota archaeon]|nr:MAG: hypothetical protein CW712_02870 [Candidatus Bathyarchaeota archaeon]